MNLSKNLTLWEVVYSRSAMEFGIQNIPNKSQINNLKKVAENVFQPARDALGVPVYVTSGFRSKELEKHFGYYDSQHTAELGAALDMQVGFMSGKTNKDLFDYIKDNLEFDQLISEYPVNGIPSWVHCSFYEGHNRKEILIAYSENGTTKYKYYE